MQASTAPPPFALSKRAVWPALFLLSAATLAFEIDLTRLFSVAQFYHFAFMIVSVALLGYGASGTTLALFPALQRADPARSIGKLALGASAAILGAYLLTNWLPFDSYSLIWDVRQVFILVLHYIALALPFFLCGMALGILFAAYPAHAGSTYAVNLLGSATGCVLALAAPSALGGEGMITLASLLAALGAVSSLRPRKGLLASLGFLVLLVFNLFDLASRLWGPGGLSLLDLHISPYKGLSYALQVPGSSTIYQRWNAFSRLDVVRSGGIHSVPGLSYRYLDPLPALDGLLVDADDLNPLVQPSANLAFTAYLPAAVAYRLLPSASTLVLEPRGGLDIAVALAQSSGSVTAVEMNPLIVDAVPVYADPRTQVYQESGRSFLQRTSNRYDVILLSLVSSFHPVQSGAYTLAEDYRYTVESFQSMLAHLSPRGVLVATRWLQDPPSEDLRLFALAVAAVDASQGDPSQQVVAFRGYNTATVLVRQTAFSPADLAAIRQFLASRAFDLTYAPGVTEAETNQFSILPVSTYYQAYLGLLQSEQPQAFFSAYPYDVSPPTDDRPFFGHTFKWEQAPQVLAEFGKAWLPFGGGGYFVILALLLLAVVLAAGLILLPVYFWRWAQRKSPPAPSPFLLRHLLYFSLLGFAFLFVEIPLLQRFILYLGNAAYAVTTVLFALLFFSGLGSYFSPRISLRYALAALTILVVGMPLLLPYLFDGTIGLPLPTRLALTVLSLSPLGFLMGVPFPAGIRWLTSGQSQAASPGAFTSGSAIPWIWAVNGAASVISPILAALLALTYGFSLVLWLGGLCYAAALVTVWLSLRHHALPPPAR